MADFGSALVRLGWTDDWTNKFQAHARPGTLPGRVGAEDKHHYDLLTAQGVCRAKVTGKFRGAAKRQEDYPKVGDWVCFSEPSKGNFRQIHQVLPRATQLSRKRPGRETGRQIVATNVDIAFIVQGLDRELNPRLLERFIVMATQGGVKPVVLLNKSDLAEDVDAKLGRIQRMSQDTEVFVASAKEGRGIEAIREVIGASTSVVFVGTSGVGKSSLINALYGEEIQATAEVREDDAKGRHTTTWRELIALPGGGVVIDTPGMREFHIWMAGDGIHEAFPDVERLAGKCRFRDCSHLVEKGCAVMAACEAGHLTRERYESYAKLRRELDFLDEAHKHRQWQERRRLGRIRRRAVEDQEPRSS